MYVAVVNESKRITHAQASLIARALSRQAHRDIGPVWGIDPPAVALHTAEADIPPGAVRCLLVDTPDIAGALGYHDQDPTGRPYMRSFVDPVLDAGGSLLEGALSVSAVASHELAEWMGDAECNRWAQRPDGRLIALELGDPVQAGAYDITIVTGHRRDEVTVSNFVYPAWFDTAPEVGARFDHLGEVKAPFTLDHGGYQIWTDGKTFGNEFATKNAEAHYMALAELKSHPSSRTARRRAAAERLVSV